MPAFFKNAFKSTRGSSFRTDIAGIRGIAVMLVTLCHFEIPGFGGGFIGPDIFFVLSGYLITGLLVKEYRKNADRRGGRGSVSLGAFYLRRARRILPASLFVLLCINVYAWLNLNVLQVAQIKADSIWTALFGANITFLRQATDYFAQNNAVSPLQHYWSLSVEEQFYFVWPVLFLAAASFHTLGFRGRDFGIESRLRAVFVVLGLGSFGWMLFEFTTSPTTAYFSTFSRAWELALGGVLSLVSVSNIASQFGKVWTVLRAVALVAMVGSISIVTPENFGHTLVIPAVATGFLLISGSATSNDMVHRLLSTRILMAFGAISFSMYLWHWPVFVFGRNLDLMDTLTQRVIGVFVCVALATLSYWLVERTFLAIPLKKAKSESSFRRPSVLVSSRTASVALTGVIVAALALVTYPPTLTFAQPTVAAWVPPASAASYAPDPSDGFDSGSAGTVDEAKMKAGLALLEANGGSSSSNQSNSELFTGAYKRWMQELATSTKSLNAGAVPTVAPKFEDVMADKAPLHNSRLALPCQKIPGIDAERCVYGNPQGKELWIIIGDSHAKMFTDAFYTHVNQLNPNVRVEQYVAYSCPNSLVEAGLQAGQKTQNPQSFSSCLKAHKYEVAAIKQNQPKVVVFSDLAVASPVNDYISGLEAFVNIATQVAEHVVVLGQTPIWPKLTDCLGQALDNLTGCNGSMTRVRKVVSAQEKLSDRIGAQFISTEEMLCVGKVCPVVISGIPVTFDGGDAGHLTWQIAKSLGPALLSRISDWR